MRTYDIAVLKYLQNVKVMDENQKYVRMIAQDIHSIFKEGSLGGHLIDALRFTYSAINMHSDRCLLLMLHEHRAGYASTVDNNRERKIAYASLRYLAENIFNEKDSAVCYLYAAKMAESIKAKRKQKARYPREAIECYKKYSSSAYAGPKKRLVSRRMIHLSHLT